MSKGPELRKRKIKEPTSIRSNLMLIILVDSVKKVKCKIRDLSAENYNIHKHDAKNIQF